MDRPFKGTSSSAYGTAKRKRCRSSVLEEIDVDDLNTNVKNEYGSVSYSKRPAYEKEQLKDRDANYYAKHY
jgi:hypothetical protein